MDRSLTLRQTIFWIHLVCGLVAGLFIFSSAVTGVMLAFEPQLVEWSEKNVREISVPESALRMELTTLVDKAKEAKGTVKISGVTVNSSPGASTFVSFGKEGGLYMNPYSGDVLGGPSRTHTFLHSVEEWHRWLLKKDIGKPITGASALVFMVLTVTGIFVWWPKTWNGNKMKAITVPKVTLKGKARDWNWHNSFGFWASCFLFMISTTGVVMSYQWATNLVYRATGTKPPPATRPPQDGQDVKNSNLHPDSDSNAVTLDRIFAIALDKVGSAAWVSIQMRLPQKTGGNVTVSIQEAEPGPGIGRRSQLTLASDGEIIKWEPFSEWNSGRRARTWMRYLHTGEAGGPLGQTVALLASLAAVFLVWTGLALTWRRYAKWRAVSKRTVSPRVNIGELCAK